MTVDFIVIIIDFDIFWIGEGVNTHMNSNRCYFPIKKGTKSDELDKKKRKVHSNVTFILGKKRMRGVLSKEDSIKSSKEKHQISSPLIIKD